MNSKKARITTSSIDLRLSGWNPAPVTVDVRQKLQNGLALFDFDGTLVPWDTQMLFADFVLRREPVRRLYLPLFATFAPLYGILGDEGLKRVFLSYLWLAESSQIETWAREFVEERLLPMCYPELLEKLEQHKSAGHLTVLASASPEFYITEVGTALGFDISFGTQVEYGSRMPLFPYLVNHKGNQKVLRLYQFLGQPEDGVWKKSHGYTDSTADLPMMACCENGTIVNPSSHLSTLGAEKGWDIIRPPVPWKDGCDKLRKTIRFASGI